MRSVLFIVLLVVHLSLSTKSRSITSTISSSPLQLHLRASELAACIGRNPFKPAHEALTEFIYRNNRLAYNLLIKSETNITTLPLTRTGDDLFHSLPVKVKNELKQSVGKLKSSDLVVQALNTAQSIAMESGQSLSLQNEEIQQLQQHVQKMHFGAFGRKTESDVAQKVQTKKSSTTFRRPITCFQCMELGQSVEVWLDGKVDGISQDEFGRPYVVEIKNRMKRLLGITKYEKVQLLAYLFLCEVEKGVLVEKYQEELCQHPLVFDSEEWDQIVEEAKGFCEKYFSTISQLTGVGAE
eukprot:gene6513-7183_t